MCDICIRWQQRYSTPLPSLQCLSPCRAYDCVYLCVCTRESERGAKRNTQRLIVLIIGTSVAKIQSIPKKETLILIHTLPRKPTLLSYTLLQNIRLKDVFQQNVIANAHFCCQFLLTNNQNPKLCFLLQENNAKVFVMLLVMLNNEPYS